MQNVFLEKDACQKVKLFSAIGGQVIERRKALVSNEALLNCRSEGYF